MFASRFKHVGTVGLPRPSGIRIMMMPVRMSNIASIPPSLTHWRGTINKLFAMSSCKTGIGYLTIDEKVIPAGETHRRRRLHVDGIYKNVGGGWGGGDNGAWGSNGMLTVASHAGCRTWNQDFIGYPKEEGECEHLREQCKEGVVFQPNEVYWLHGLCVHESLPMKEPTYRQFVRLSMPSTSPWFEGYTVNPLGILPEVAILPRRPFMDM